MEIPLDSSNQSKLTALAKARFSSDLRPAELRVIYDSVREGPAKAASAVPPAARHVRGEFLRWILSDPAAALCFDKDGLQVVSGIIDGDVDLDSAAIAHDIRFDDCVFTGDLHTVNATLKDLTISNSTIEGDVNLQNATVHGDIFLNPGLTTFGAISTFGARISGDVNLSGAKLLAQTKEKTQAALSLNETAIAGTLNLTGISCDVPLFVLFATIGNVIATSATFKSIVHMTGTSIKEDLTLAEAQFVLPKTAGGIFSVADTAALNLERMSIGDSVYLSGASLRCQPNSLSMRDTAVLGTVYLTEDVQAFGELDLSGVKINQGLYIFQSTLADLNAHQSQIGSLLVIQTKLGAFDVSGSQISQLEWAGIVDPHAVTLNLTRSHVKMFRDDQNSWPLPGHLQIVGLVYDDIELEVPRDRSKVSTPAKDGGTDPDDRIAWLRLQSKGDIVASQPWTQLAQYVQSTGNLAGARKVLYDMKRIQASSEGGLKELKTLVPDYLDENPWRVTYFTGGFWGIGALLFWRAQRLKAMAPKDETAYDNFTRNGVLTPDVPPFNPAVYTLENVLPVVKFGQDDAWGPDPAFGVAPPGGWKRWLPRYSYSWLAFARLLLIILGWALAIILAGVIGGLFKS